MCMTSHEGDESETPWRAAPRFGINRSGAKQRAPLSVARGFWKQRFESRMDP